MLDAGQIPRLVDAADGVVIKLQKAGGISPALVQALIGGERTATVRAVTACELLDIPLTAKRQRQLEPLLPDALAQLLAALKQQRAWPASW